MQEIRKVVLMLTVVACLFGSVLVAQAAPIEQTAAPATAETKAEVEPVELTVLSPQGDIPLNAKPAERLDTLDGKNVALFLLLPNTFEFQPAGNAFFDSIEAKLTKDFPTVKLARTGDFYEKGLELIKASDPDAVILGMGG
jgi:ABC-type enterochelin transport system substrate-binding protein